MSASSPVKTCTKCGLTLPLTENYFSKHKEGFESRCKACRNQTNKLWRENNKKHISEYNKLYNAEHKELINELKKRWWNNQSKEYKREQDKKRRPKRREYKNAISRKWRHNNPEKRRMLKQKRKAKERQLPSTLTIEQWNIVKNCFNNECAYCGKRVDLQQEHFIALSNGGEYTHNNIIPACGHCNASKHNKDFFKWYPQYEHYSKKREKIILEFLGYTRQGLQQPMLML